MLAILIYLWYSSLKGKTTTKKAAPPMNDSAINIEQAANRIAMIAARMQSPVRMANRSFADQVMEIQSLIVQIQAASQQIVPAPIIEECPEWTASVASKWASAD